jgi:methylmalonyl-CoA mutase cobalamin-binding subunit
VLPVTAQALTIFREHLDASIGLEPGTAERAAAIDKADQGDAVVISAEQGHDHQLYKAARDRAKERGIPLRIEGDAGEGSIDPGELAPITANGTAGEVDT